MVLFHISSKTSVAGYANSIMGATEVCGLDGDLTTITIEGRKSLQNAKYVHIPVPPPPLPNNLPFLGHLFSRLREFIPIHFTQKNGFDSIAEWLNIIRGGHLRIVATKDIPPKTEVVMDYHITRACFHPTSCTNSKLFVLCIAKIFTKMFGNK